MRLVKKQKASAYKLTTKSKVKPVGASIMIAPIPVPSTSTSGCLIIPDTARDKPLIGTIIAYGDPRETGEEFDGKWPPFPIGTTVIYGRFAGEDLRLEDAEESTWPKILKARELLGVLED